MLSPVAGTFYGIPEPDADPYAETGDVVEVERELCFIQTMEPVREAVPDLPADYSGDEIVEVLHQVVADVPGAVVEVLVEEAEAVEAGQELFRLRIDQA